MLSLRFVTRIVMSELPAGDAHDVIHRGGRVVAVVVPIEEYRQLRQAMQEQQVNEELDAARAGYLARRQAGALRYVSHEVCRPCELSGQLGDPSSGPDGGLPPRRSRRCRGALGYHRPARR